jgi:anti-anti-sigma factor
VRGDLRAVLQDLFVMPEERIRAIRAGRPPRAPALVLARLQLANQRSFVPGPRIEATEMSQPLAVETIDHDLRQVRLRVDGDLDLESAPQLLALVHVAARRYDRHDIVLDLAGLTFIDSSGLHALIAAHGDLVNGRSHLVVMNASPMATRLFEISGADSVLDIRHHWQPSG